MYVFRINLICVKTFNMYGSFTNGCMGIDNISVYLISVNYFQKLFDLKTSLNVSAKKQKKTWNV